MGSNPTPSARTPSAIVHRYPETLRNRPGLMGLLHPHLSTLDRHNPENDDGLHDGGRWVARTAALGLLRPINRCSMPKKVDAATGSRLGRSVHPRRGTRAGDRGPPTRCKASTRSSIATPPPQPSVGSGRPGRKPLSRMRGRIESVLDFAKTRGARQGESPACWKRNLALRLLADRGRFGGHRPSARLLPGGSEPTLEIAGIFTVSIIGTTS